MKEGSDITTIEIQKYEMLARVRDFGDAYGDRFPESTLAKPLFATVAKAVTELQAHDVSKQSTAHGGGLSARDTARKALADHLLAITITARAVGLDTPGLEDKFQIPKRPKDQVLLTTGRLFARDAEAFKPAFVAHGQTETFLADLAEEIEQFDRALRDYDAGKDEHAAARASIEAALTAGTVAVQKLHAIVINRLNHDPVVMATWNRDRRVRYPRGRHAVAEAGAPASPVTQASQASTDPGTTPQAASTEESAAK